MNYPEREILIDNLIDATLLAVKNSLENGYYERAGELMQGLGLVMQARNERQLKRIGDLLEKLLELAMKS